MGGCAAGARGKRIWCATTGLNFGWWIQPEIGDRSCEGCGATEPTLCRLLMIVSATGGEPRVLPRAENLFFQGPIGWTPDGRHLVVTRVTANPYASDAPQRLYAVAVDTGEMTPLGIDMPQITSRVVSADGRRIAITQEWSRNEVRALRNVLAASGTARWRTRLTGA